MQIIVAARLQMTTETALAPESLPVSPSINDRGFIQLLTEFLERCSSAHLGASARSRTVHGIVSYDSNLCWGCGKGKHESCKDDCLLERTRKALALEVAPRLPAEAPPLKQPQRSEFWKQYQSAADREAPQLRTPKKAHRGVMRFAPLGLPSRVSLVHKLAVGYVDLEFEGFGERLEILEQIYGRSLAGIQGMYIEQAGSDGIIRARVSPVNSTLPFKEQEQKLVAALLRACEVLEWFKMGNLTHRLPE
jgi:hypothetical protein